MKWIGTSSVRKIYYFSSQENMLKLYEELVKRGYYDDLIVCENIDLKDEDRFDPSKGRGSIELLKIGGPKLKTKLE